MNVENLSNLCWNVSGLGDPNKCSVIKETIKKSNIMIFFCLQETKLSDISLSKFYSFAPASFHNHASGNANSSRGGTIIAWKPSFTLNHSYQLTYSNMTILSNNLGFQFMLTNVYRPTDNNYKADFL
jgi:exonuclease III